MKLLPEYIVIHHSATDENASYDDIKNNHLSRGMDDIGYHFLIDKNGKNITGRDITQVGAHALGLNDRSIGICCIGDYRQKKPSPKVLESLIRLILKLRSDFKIPAKSIIGHCDVVSISPSATKTECPGNALYDLIDYIRNRTEPSESIANTAFDQNYRAEIKDVDFKFQNFLITIKGKIINQGLYSWNDKTDNSNNPIRIGMLIYRESHKELDELRYDLDGRVVISGDEIEFFFEINSRLYPEGKIKFIISAVKEREFWFHQKGSEPHILEFDLKHPAVLPEVKKLIDIQLPNDCSQVRILFISPTLPFFDRDAGGRRQMLLLEALAKFGCKITFLYEGINSISNSQKYIDMLDKLGIECIKNPLSYLVTCNESSFTACVIGWHECASRYLPIIREVLPKTKIIVDSVDIHWVREERGLAFGQSSYSAMELDLRKKKEITTYNQADEVWVVSEEDREALTKELPDCSAKVISAMSKELSTTVIDLKENGIIFVGSFSHPPNESAALWGYEIVRQFKKYSGVECKYYIVGSNPPPSILSLHDGNSVIVTGFVEDLNEYYRKSKVFLAPIKFGAGVKGKVTDAACAGLPVITTNVGNEGINLVNGKEAFICESTTEFVDALSSVFNGTEPIKLMGRLAAAKVMHANGILAAGKPLKAAFVASNVTIAIVTYNKKHLIEKCLQTILQLTKHSNFRIVVVSNACTDGTVETIKNLQEQYPQKIDLIINEENKFFVEPTNFIIRNYPYSDVLLLNNDTEIVDPNWIQELQNAAYTSNFIGCAGCIVVDADGVVSEAGAYILNNGKGINRDRGILKDQVVRKIGYVGFVSGCCMYMRRDWIDKFGVLDYQFSPMYFEDVEWQYRLHQFGVKTIFTPRTFIVHKEGSSAGTDLSSGMKSYQKINQAKFIEKFANVDLEKLNG